MLVANFQPLYYDGVDDDDDDIIKILRIPYNRSMIYIFIAGIIVNIRMLY